MTDTVSGSQRSSTSAYPIGTAPPPYPAPALPPHLRALPDGQARPIVLWPDPVLIARCEPAAVLDWREIGQLSADLLATMYQAQGRGLAAPQLGVPVRMFVMDAGWKQGSPEPMVVIDPWLRHAGPSGDAHSETMDEACLSIPGQSFAVTRPTRVQLSWFTLDGVSVSVDLDGIAARIAQHEYDHLQGRLINGATGV